MESARPAAWILFVSMAVGALFLLQIGRNYHNPYPPMPTSLAGSQSNLQDAGGIVLGTRRLAADLAWVQTLQYYGTPEAGQSEEDSENGAGRYPLFYDYCRQVVAIDPYFVYAYLYGGAVLGWNLNRLPEAEALIKQGIANNPAEWRLPQYLAGLAYQKNHNVAGLIQFLETLVQDPQCPLMMKALLANIYKKQHEFDKALVLWAVIYQSGDPNYTNRALYQIKEIHKMRHSHP